MRVKPIIFRLLYLSLIINIYKRYIGHPCNLSVLSSSGATLLCPSLCKDTFLATEIATALLNVGVQDRAFVLEFQRSTFVSDHALQLHLSTEAFLLAAAFKCVDIYQDRVYHLCFNTSKIIPNFFFWIILKICVHPGF